MKRVNLYIVKLCALFIVLISLGACSAATNEGALAFDPAIVGQNFVDTLARKDYAGAVGKMDAIGKMAYTPEKLQSLWETTLTQYGEFQSQALDAVAPAENGARVRIKCALEHGAIVISLSLNKSGQITGLAFTES